ncbi:Macrolide export ATP-binding/permease protein MacB [bioreactor metagenome]|uniref:Macrolide export ATP-binding/permease protein MacB n=1 Tax=bioreactor metagenome TaxID=1076179 RepID=A0A644X8W4_9ZZZZ
MTAILMALESIKEKKVRSFLTMLGIIIGVTAVLVLVALVSGYNADVTAYYEKLGVNKVTVNLTWYDTTRAADITDSLYEYGNSLTGMVTGVTPDLSTTGTLKYRTTNIDTSTIYLGGDQFSTCNNYTLSKGRDINAYDISTRNPVCVIGSYVAESLFQYSDPIGQTLLVNGSPFVVVGIYYEKDGSTESSMDDAILVPYSFNRVLLQDNYITSFIVKVNSSSNMTTVIANVKAFLEENIDSNVGKYTVKNGNSSMTESQDEMTNISLVLGGVAGIALLVGGIGIMNIMLVTVSERTREIGIKKSIGAPASDIIMQFLVEAGILSAMGGLIGIILGYALSVILGKAFYDVIVFPNALVTIGAFLFSIAIGIGFGLYPAVKAAKLQPVDALRAD